MWSREQRMLNVYIHSKTYQTQQPAAAHLSSHPPLTLHPHFTSLLVTHSLLSFFSFFTPCYHLYVSVSVYLSHFSLLQPKCLSLSLNSRADRSIQFPFQRIRSLLCDGSNQKPVTVISKLPSRTYRRQIPNDDRWLLSKLRALSPQFRQKLVVVVVVVVVSLSKPIIYMRDGIMNIAQAKRGVKTLTLLVH